MNLENVQVETMLVTWPDIERLHNHLQGFGGALVLRGFTERDHHRYAIFTAPGYQVAARVDWVCNLSWSE